MTQTEFAYRGHRILVGLSMNGDRFAWEFRIDDGKLIALLASPAADESAALAEAQSAARSVIDLREG